MMVLVVSGAAAVGFLSSVVMLWMGLRYMPVRYAVASLAGYGVFLSLMNRWLGHHSRSALLDGITDVANSSIEPIKNVLTIGSFGRGRQAEKHARLQMAQ